MVLVADELGMLGSGLQAHKIMVVASIACWVQLMGEGSVAAVVGVLFMEKAGVAS